MKRYIKCEHTSYTPEEVKELTARAIEEFKKNGCKVEVINSNIDKYGYADIRIKLLTFNGSLENIYEGNPKIGNYVGYGHMGLDFFYYHYSNANKVIENVVDNYVKRFQDALNTLEDIIDRIPKAKDVASDIKINCLHQIMV